MTRDLQFLLLGLGNGAVYAALALALVMTYRSSGVVNFATGAIALYIAYTYAYLRDGELLIPIPGFPKTIDLGGPLGLAPAMAIALLIAAALGVLLYFAVFRLLRTAPATAKAVASIAVMLAVQALLAARVGTSPVSVEAILPTNVIEIGDIRVPADRLWFAGGDRRPDDLADPGVPADPVRSGHPCRRRIGEGSHRHRSLARTHRVHQLGVVDDDRRSLRHPDRADRPVDPHLLHAVHRPGSRCRAGRQLQLPSVLPSPPVWGSVCSSRR